MAMDSSKCFDYIASSHGGRVMGKDERVGDLHVQTSSSLEPQAWQPPDFGPSRMGADDEPVWLRAWLYARSQSCKAVPSKLFVAFSVRCLFTLLELIENSQRVLTGVHFAR
jgi:hypothetical protein